ncbi:Jag N-terminal domain-containing protein [Gemmiger formicilis]|nr:Jag N-terminal domain-containing protein [Gemmiger formicilis]
MRSMEMSAKTVEAAVQAACEALGVDRDDINVSYEVLEFPTRKLFKTIPAKVLVKVEEPRRKSRLKFPQSPPRLLKSLTRPPLKSRRRSSRIWSRRPSWPRPR